MKTWKRALALVLALVMALSLVALPSFAEGEDDTGTGDGMPRVAYEGGQTEGVSGIYMSKTLKDNGNGQFLLTLEAYVTGTVTTVTQDSPMDIVLVLDVSGSMDDPINKVYKDQLDTSKTYKIASGGDYVEVQYNTSKGNWGYYINYVIGSRWKSVTPKTSENDTNSDNVQFYETTSRLDALQSAVNAFIASAQTMSPSSRIAIVKFASYTDDSYQKTEIVKNLTTLDDNGVSELQSAVSALYANGATRADIGMQLANNILDSAAKESGNTRRQLAIMFTDGDPTGESGNFNTTTANSAISNAKNIKDRVVTIPGDNGTTVQSHGTVYTIGCFDTVPSTGSNPDKYMNYVSSNYPSAASLKNPGVAGEKQGYYQTATSADSLKDIFRSISSETGAINGDLKSQTVLQDVISDSFNIDTSDGKAILVHSESCTAIDSTGAPTSWSRDDTVYSYTQEGKTVKVTNFDYKENWVGAMDNKAHGKKIVLEIPIVLTDTATGTVNTNVNETGANSSAIYNDEGKQVADFQSPTVYIPYFTVTHVASTVDSATGANKGVVGASENYPLWCYKEFNLTSVVTRNYLYGGTFNEDTCINVHNDVQEQGNPMKLNPTENATYYIWEVPDTYLRPFGYWISRHLEGGQGTLSVTQLYLLAAVDRVNYADAGLKVSFGNGTSQYISSSCEELSNPNTEQLGSATVYQMLETVKGHAGGEVIDTWYLKNGIPVNYEGPLTKSEETGKYLDANDKNNSPIDDGCIIGHRLKGKEFESFQKSGVTYRPYWVTLDGVRVEGVRSRNYTFVVGSADPGKPSKDDQLPAVYQYLEKQQSAQTLTLRTNLLAGDTEPAVNDLTVTVIDGSNAPQTIKVAPNGSVRDQVAYQAPAGKVFAGWFTDDSFTTPADLDQVTQDTTIYAKYVSDSYLDLDYSRTGLFRLRGVTLISAVDNPANYQVSGFIVGDQKVDVSYASRYRIFKTPANLFGAARDAKLMLADKSLSGAGDLEVTPYWVTLDGTEVHGVTHTLHYNTRTIWE
jgi:uncharacterized repeat protein (TIGR02543 family)